jgi:hypothetical protein
MSEIVNNWVKGIAQGEGILAVGVRYHDRQVFAWSNATDFQPSELDMPMRCLADTFRVITANRLPARRLRWSYENAFVHGVMRADGICLGIIARKHDATPDPQALDRIASEFQSLHT